MKDTVWKMIQFVCAGLFIVALLPIANRAIGSTDDLFPDAGKYTSGNADITETVRNLDIDWTGGKVSIARQKGKTVSISEKSNGPISPDMEMRWFLDGETLRIRFAKPGLHLKGNLKKELTVTLPEGISLDSVEIGSASGMLDIPELQAEQIMLHVTSGDIFAAVEARVISCRTTSGNIMIEAGSSDTAKFETTSGSVFIKMKDVGSLQAESTSGDIDAEIGRAGRAVIRSTSGDVRLITEGPDELKIKTTSGDVEAFLPQDPGFTAQLHSTSGRINVEVPAVKEGSAYVCGDGSGEVEIHTTSGRIEVAPYKG